MKRISAVFMAFVLACGLLAGCGDGLNGDTEKNSGTPDTAATVTESGAEGSTAPTPENTANAYNDMFTDRDFETGFDESECITVLLNGDSASASSDSVHISGSTVTLTGNATHIISGRLDDGMIIVDAGDSAKLQLVLNGVSINSETSAPLYILSADKVFVTLADSTENTLSNGGAFSAIDENNIDGVLFSKLDLTLNGGGSLTVTSPAGHGIVCKDDLVITGGEYSISCASHGLDANDSVRIGGDASVTIDAGKDGIHADNSDDTSLGFVYIGNGNLKIEAEGDGVSAGAYMQIEGGTVDILAGGGSVNATKEASDSWGGFMGRGGFSPMMPSSQSTSVSDSESTSMKGLKSAGDTVISGGNITVDSADDGIHSDASVTLSGGTFEIATGDDGVHAEENLTVTAGAVTITESYEGLEALHIAIEGGEIRLTASDDGLNAAGGTDSSGMTGGRDGMFKGGKGGMGAMSASSGGTIVISGGSVYINASGDGIDSNGSLEITGGYTVVCGPAQGDTSTLDYDTSAVIAGGTFIGTGASSMAQSFSDSGQGVVAVRTGTNEAGTVITLADSDGNTVISHSPELAFQVIILSSPEIVSGESYTLTVGGVGSEVKAS